MFIKTKEWYKNKVYELEDWLMDEKIIPSNNQIEKKAFQEVLYKVIDIFDEMDDEECEELLRNAEEWY